MKKQKESSWKRGKGKTKILFMSKNKNETTSLSFSSFLLLGVNGKKFIYNISIRSRESYTYYGEGRGDAWGRSVYNTNQWSWIIIGKVNYLRMARSVFLGAIDISLPRPPPNG